MDAAVVFEGVREKHSELKTEVTEHALALVAIEHTAATKAEEDAAQVQAFEKKLRGLHKRMKTELEETTNSMKIDIDSCVNEKGENSVMII